MASKLQRMLQKQKDKKVKALHPSKSTSASGATYYEKRGNRSDVDRRKKYAGGGGVKTGSLSGIEYYAVLDEKNLGYVFADTEGKEYFAFLRASILKGSSFDDERSGPIAVENYSYSLRKATPKDFDEYRVSLPPDFYSLNEGMAIKGGTITELEERRDELKIKKNAAEEKMIAIAEKCGGLKGAAPFVMGDFLQWHFKRAEDESEHQVIPDEYQADLDKLSEDVTAYEEFVNQSDHFNEGEYETGGIANPAGELNAQLVEGYFVKGGKISAKGIIDRFKGKINSVQAVKDFFQAIYDDLNTMVDPDTPFADVTHFESDTPAFSAEDAKDLDEIMDSCFSYCKKNEIDPYDIALEMQTKEFIRRGLHGPDIGGDYMLFNLDGEQKTLTELYRIVGDSASAEEWIKVREMKSGEKIQLFWPGLEGQFLEKLPDEEFAKGGPVSVVVKDLEALGKLYETVVGYDVYQDLKQYYADEDKALPNEKALSEIMGLMDEDKADSPEHKESLHRFTISPVYKRIKEKYKHLLKDAVFIGEEREFRYLTLIKRSDGLYVGLTKEGQEWINQNGAVTRDNFYELFEDVQGNSEYMFIPDAGEAGLGMTSAEAITDGYHYGEDGELEPVDDTAEVYWYEQYQISDPFEQLTNNGEVVFLKAEAHFEEDAESHGITYADGRPVPFEIKGSGQDWEIWKKDGINGAKPLPTSVVVDWAGQINKFNSYEFARKALIKMLKAMHADQPGYNPKIKYAAGGDMANLAPQPDLSFAQGGMIEHGLQPGDIVLEIYKGYGIMESAREGRSDVIFVLDPMNGTRVYCGLDDSKSLGQQWLGYNRQELIDEARARINERVAGGKDIMTEDDRRLDGSAITKLVEFAKGGDVSKQFAYGPVIEDPENRNRVIFKNKDWFEFEGGVDSGLSTLKYLGKYNKQFPAKAFTDDYPKFTGTAEVYHDKNTGIYEWTYSGGGQLSNFVPQPDAFAFGGVVGEKRAKELASYVVRRAGESGNECPALKKFSEVGFEPTNVIECLQEVGLIGTFNFPMPYEDRNRLRDYFDQYLPDMQQIQVLEHYGAKKIIAYLKKGHFSSGGNVSFGNFSHKQHMDEIHTLKGRINYGNQMVDEAGADPANACAAKEYQIGIAKNKEELLGKVAHVTSPEYVELMMVRTTNDKANVCAELKRPFIGNNLEGKILQNGDYAVLSFGHYPIWYWNGQENKWYGNSDKYSEATAEHLVQSRPDWDAKMVTHAELMEIMRNHEAKFNFGGALANLFQAPYPNISVASSGIGGQTTGNPAMPAGV